MPFIKKERRSKIDAGDAPRSYGELCYKYYKKMVDEFRQSSNWDAVHNISKYWILESSKSEYGIDDLVAIRLALQVFLWFYVLPYEEKKRLENGDI